MKVKKIGARRLVLEAENRHDQAVLTRIEEEQTSLPPFHWFKGSVDHELLKKLDTLGAI